MQKNLVFYANSNTIVFLHSLGSSMYQILKHTYIFMYQRKDSYRYGWNTPTLTFENLKPVDKSKNHFKAKEYLKSEYNG